jgi:hypothetical protein
MPPHKICKRCGFYEEERPLSGGVITRGVCHRYPERTQVVENHWCGEYRTKLNLINWDSQVNENLFHLDMKEVWWEWRHLKRMYRADDIPPQE